MWELTYRNISLELSSSEQNYAFEIRKNNKMQENAVEKFLKTYSNYDSMDTAMEKLCEDLLEIIKYFAEQYVSEWVKKGHYELDTHIFLTDYYSQFVEEGLCIEDTYYEVEEKYTDIIMTKEQKEEYRKLRKQSRGRWVGGGFGIGGAVSGVATAGAINIVTGLGHSMVNAVGNIASSISASNKKSKLYSESKDLFIEALKQDIFYLMYANMAYAVEKEDKSYAVPNAEDCKQANAILSNIPEISLEETEKCEIIKKLFALNPYNNNLYKYLLSLYGDSDKQLASIANYFGKTAELESMKSDYIFEVYNKNSKKTWEDYKKLEDELFDLIDYYGMIDNADTIELMDSVHNKYDELYKEASTYNKVIYASPEEAETMKHETNEINAIKKEIDNSDFDSLEDALGKLDAMTCKVYKDKENDIKSIKRKLSDFEKKEVNDILSQIDEYDLKSINKALEELQNLQVKYYDKKGEIKKLQSDINNFGETSKVFLNHTLDSVEDAIQLRDLLECSIALVEQEQYEQAINTLNQCTIPEVKEDMKKQIQDKSEKQLESQIRHAKFFKKGSISPDISLGEAFAGIVIVSIIGFIATIFISYLSIVIAGIIDIFIIIAYIFSIIESIKDKITYEKEYNMLMNLNHLGYDFKFDD